MGQANGAPAADLGGFKMPEIQKPDAPSPFGRQQPWGDNWGQFWATNNPNTYNAAASTPIGQMQAQMGINPNQPNTLLPGFGGGNNATQPPAAATPSGSGTGSGTSGGSPGPAAGGGAVIPPDLAGMPEFGGSGYTDTPDFGGLSTGGGGAPGGTGGGVSTGGGSPVNQAFGYGGAATTNNSTNSGTYQQATGAAGEFFEGNSNIYDPFQALQNLGSSIASFGSQSIPGAAAFQQGLFNPGFNAAENAFMENQADLVTRTLNKQMADLGGRFSKTPFHSGYLNTARELGDQASQNLLNMAGQIQLNRQGLAAQAAQGLVGNPLGAMQTAANVTPAMLQLIQQQQMAPLSAGLSYLNGSPTMAPSIIAGAQTVGGSGGGKK